MSDDHHYKRNPFNTNQRLIFSSPYLGLPIQVAQGPSVEEYLDKLLRTIITASLATPRVFAVRIDLRYSRRADLPADATANAVIERFIASLRYRLNSNYACVKVRDGKANKHHLRYVWAREVGQESGRPHCHVLLLLNGDAYRSVGDYTNPDADCLYNRIRGAWASAIGVDYHNASGLVSLPPGRSSWMLHQSDDQALEDVFYAASYLCKAATKEFGSRAHGFNASRL